MVNQLNNMVVEGVKCLTRIFLKDLKDLNTVEPLFSLKSSAHERVSDGT